MGEFNTGNPSPSLDERDFYDNILNLDAVMNSDEETWHDRFGTEKPTITSALRSVGFMPAGFDFISGGTLHPGDRNKAVFNPNPTGDNNWYRWNGSFPKVIDPNSQPEPKNTDAWVLVNIKTEIIEREALKRTYREAGYNLVPGSFEQGGTLVNNDDVLLHEKTGKCYSGPVGVVPKGTNPLVGGFVDRSIASLKGILISTDPALGLRAIPLANNDSIKDSLGTPITNNGDKLKEAFSKASNPIHNGTFKTPIELGIKTGQLVYWTKGGTGGLITNLARYFPNGYNLGPGSAEANGLKAYYVSQNGSDANDGLSWQTPLASITTAVNKADADIVFITAGRWTISNGFTGKTLTRDLVLCCPEGEAFISNQRETTWTNNGNGTFTSTTLGGTPIRVVDMRYVDDFGDPIWFSKKTTLAEVQATPYSWAITAGSGSTQVVTINLPNLTPNNNNTLVLRSASVQVDFNIQPFKFYAKNICFFGGDSASMTPKNGIDGSNYISENCRYISAHQNDSLRVQGIGLCISIRCKGSNGEKDGFNYHGATNINGDMIHPHFIEIECVSHNHKTTFGTSNGSTAHESCIGFRIAGVYGYGVGPGVADIGDTKTFNVACTSNGGYGDSNAKGFLPADNCKMWLHNCSGFGNRTADFAPQDNAILYVKGSYAETYAKTGNGSIVNF